MADKHTERAIRNLRERHTGAAISAAAHIQGYAGYILRDLKAGKIPSFHLVDDVVELERRSAALDAIKDVKGIYDAEEADRRG